MKGHRAGPEHNLQSALKTILDARIPLAVPPLRSEVVLRTGMAFVGHCHWRRESPASMCGWPPWSAVTRLDRERHVPLLELV